MRYLFIGGDGMLAGELIRQAKEKGHETLWTSRRGGSPLYLDLIDGQFAIPIVTKLRPDKVFICAAVHGLEQCEKDPDLATKVNAIAPSRIAWACGQFGARCIYVSTDYVFDGELDPPLRYHPTSRTSPRNVYGHTKAFGEYLVLKEGGTVARTAFLYGPVPPSGKKSNLALSILGKIKEGAKFLRYHENVRCSPTLVRNAASMILGLECRGVYHCVDEGSPTLLDFAEAVCKMTASRTIVRPSTSTDPLRPLNTAMHPSFRGATIWTQALRGFLAETGNILT